MKCIIPHIAYAKLREYGKEISCIKFVILYVITCVLAFLMGTVFKLELIQKMVIVIYVFACTPYILIGRAKSSYYERQFREVNKYMEKMLYYFKNSSKLLDSWIMIAEIFPQGEMHELVNNMIAHVKISDNLEIGKAEAIRMLSDKYSCNRLSRMHELFLQVEHDGGEYDMAIELLLKDRQLWSERVEELQNRKRFTRVNVILSMFIVTVLCLSVMYLPGMIASNVSFVDIGKIKFVQISAILYLILSMLVYLKVDKKLCVNWLKDDSFYTEDEARIKYEYLTNKEDTLRNRFRHHTLKYHASMRVYKKQLRLAMPAWVIRLALLLQTENVHVAIRESYEDASGCLKPAIRKLISEIEMAPDSELPYEHFLEEFEIADFEDVMSTLYSIQSGAGGDVLVEIRNIVDRAINLSDKAEKIRNDDRMAAMQTYIALPGLIGAVKLMIDMSAFLMSFLSIRVM